MKKKIITIICLLLFVLTSFAQNRAVVYGKITNPSTRTLKIKYAQNIINGSEVVIETDLDFSGDYAVALEISEPLPVTLIYGDKEMLLFLNPDSKLELNFDNKDFYNSMTFSGIGFNDNSFIHRYVQKFGMRDKFEEAIVFPSVSVPDSIFNKMNELSSDDFTMYVAQRQDAERRFYQNDSIQEDFTPGLKNYYESMITYKWASYLFAYANLRSKRGEMIPDAFYIFLWDLEISNDEAMINPNYGAFLDIYLDYAFKSMHGDSINERFKRFALTFELAEMQLSGFAEEYMLGRLLSRTIKPTNIPFITAYYNKFQKRSVVSSYLNAVTDVYDRALSFSDKQAAPDFLLQTPGGDTVSLEQFRGKLVYISFWASWCQPCLQEQQESLSNRVELLQQDIVFLYVSVDEKKDDWVQYLERHPNYSINIWATGRQNNITRSYNVISLPHYFLLDRNGKFITEFKKASDPEFLFDIRRLLEQ
jgi:thiol-disulfide isomerase/thioredoxin/outer membrane lipoprotein-sorting protein